MPMASDSTATMCGFSTFYEQLFPLVRRINDKLPPQKKLRILACDPPIDWSRVRSAEDVRPFMDRDQKHRRGDREGSAREAPKGTDAVRDQPHAARTSAMGRIERNYANVTLVIADYQGFAESAPLAPASNRTEP